MKHEKKFALKMSSNGTLTISKEILGEGSYGCVKLGTIVKDNNVRECAIKIMYAKSNLSGFYNFNEIEILYKLGKSCDFIVDLFKVEIWKHEKDRNYTSDKYCKGYISPVLELAQCDGMRYFENADYTFEQVRLMCTQILLGVDHMHRNGICHRDLKSSNLLVFLRGTEPHIKITDFGFATILPFKGERESRVHTIWYRAPEIMFKVNNYKTTSDNWCVGIIFIEMMINRHFFEDVGSDPSVTQYMEFCVENIADEWTQDLQVIYRSFSDMNQSVKIFNHIKPKKFHQKKQDYVQFIINNCKLRENREGRDGRDNRDNRAFRQKLKQFSNMVKELLTFNYIERPQAFTVVTRNPFFEPLRGYVMRMHEKQYQRRTHERVFFQVPEQINDLKVEYFMDAVNRFEFVYLRHFFYAVDLVNKFFTNMANYEYEPRDVFAACLYFVHKMFCFISNSKDPQLFFFHKYSSSNIDITERNFLDEFLYTFEYNLVINYDQYGSFIRPSIYDMQDCYRDSIDIEPHNLTRDTLIMFLREFCKISSWTSNKSYRYMYRLLYKKIVDENFEIN